MGTGPPPAMISARQCDAAESHDNVRKPLVAMDPRAVKIDVPGGTGIPPRLDLYNDRGHV